MDPIMTTPAITIREARSDTDYYRAYPIIRQLIPQLDMQTYARRVFVARATGYRMFIAESVDELIGVIGMVPNHNIHDGFVTYIEHVVVDQKHRGKGYGRLLIEFAEQRALEDGCNLLQLDTEEGAGVDQLYLKNGYRRTGSYFSKDLGARSA
ncbi:MAG: GNAT family N-acetyltransferase [Methylobacterium sp.]|jgi:GNAT superfamily N-acetyltransferase|nr:GNAT family N-acetyltransferase [Methylobacterium sp.]MCA3598579.1 GNAT family N-acetyltransferase [Methylobacterium sp.]MCA3599999.1 GNAT family N-acetyltransferase [Methylobacterium sp.]MCA3602029.1 GNAT family N-acetyltransferase [Methylobacterium sp.]MCA3604976.1 GNAT family N-acetyltransferase [Methylobacterium sp.]